MKRLLLLSTVALLLVSCEYNNKLKYNETQCSDPWLYDSNPSVHKENIREYLKGHGIETGDIQITTDPDAAQTCLACVCQSGRIIHITVSDGDKELALALGFEVE